LIKPNNVHQSLKKRIVTYQVADLDANGDLTDIPVFRCPCALEIVEIGIIPQGDDAGIDADNTSVWLTEVGSTALVTKTYNNTVTFPDKGVYESLGTVGNGKRDEGDIVTLSITNGTTANTPAVILQVEYVIADEAFFDTIHTTNYAT